MSAEWARSFFITLEKTMPTETILALVPVFLLFAFFAGTMLWVDQYSQKK